jgi:hypothetical protein
LKKRLSLVAVSAAALAAFVPTLASGAEATSPVAPTGKTDTIYIRGAGHGVRFVGPKTVGYGDELKIVNQTNPKKIGPHTFSLVESSLVPKTRRAEEVCFTKGHICKAIAIWHGAKGNGPPKINPVDVGTAGWSTEGNLSKKGDSWFTGEKPGTSIEQQVTAEPGTTIHYICAIHPWMHGSFKVEAPPATS